MKFSLEAPSGANQIHSYDDNSIVISTIDSPDLQTIDTRLILTPSQLITEWTINNITELSDSDVAYFKSLDPEVLIFAQNSNFQIPPKIIVKFSQQAIGVESMLLGAACRTYNLLAAEGRRVVLAINFD